MKNLCHDDLFVKHQSETPSLKRLGVSLLINGNPISNQLTEEKALPYLYKMDILLIRRNKITTDVSIPFIFMGLGLCHPTKDHRCLILH
jgi:hypothetical protein